MIPTPNPNLWDPKLVLALLQSAAVPQMGDIGNPASQPSEPSAKEPPKEAPKPADKKEKYALISYNGHVIGGPYNTFGECAIVNLRVPAAHCELVPEPTP